MAELKDCTKKWCEYRKIRHVHINSEKEPANDITFYINTAGSWLPIGTMQVQLNPFLCMRH